MRYLDERCVPAQYSEKFSGNPWISALPEMMPREEFEDRIRKFPPIPMSLLEMDTQERRGCLHLLSSLFVPMDYMYFIYDLLYRSLQGTYSARTAIDIVTQTNAIRGYHKSAKISYATQSDSGAILGTPGIGKTSTIRRCMSLIPQVIEHTQYMNRPFFCKQVTYLHVECPSDCSIKTLAFNIVAALDMAVGSTYITTMSSILSTSASAAAVQVKTLCLTFHIGVILIDEIQNAVTTATKNRQAKPLIRFLVELTNDTCTSVYFIGTHIAEELFLSEEHLKRRTRGIRLLPMRPDGLYYEFISILWKYQFTPQHATLNEKIINLLYDFSGGIPAYLVKIFQQAQAQALIQGDVKINEKIIQQAVTTLSIPIPHSNEKGISIFDFNVNRTEDKMKCKIMDTKEVKAAELTPHIKPLGRKAIRRSINDLLVWYENECFEGNLLKNGMLEEFVC